MKFFKFGEYREREINFCYIPLIRNIEIKCSRGRNNI